MKPMNKKTRTALNKSIAHWERLATGKATNESIFSDGCALCKLFLDKENKTCDGCPVKRKTGRNMCKGTPWTACRNAKNVYGKQSPQFQAKAQLMVKFLKSLK